MAVSPLFAFSRETKHKPAGCSKFPDVSATYNTSDTALAALNNSNNKVNLNHFSAETPLALLYKTDPL